MLVYGAFRSLYQIGNNLCFLCGTVFQNGGDFIKGGAGGCGGWIIQQVIGSHFQGTRDIHENGQAQFGVPGFNVAHMGGGDAHLLCQFLLGKPVCLADFAYLLPYLVVIHQITAYIVKLYLNYIGVFDRIT